MWRISKLTRKQLFSRVRTRLQRHDEAVFFRPALIGIPCILSHRHLMKLDGKETAAGFARRVTFRGVFFGGALKRFKRFLKQENLLPGWSWAPCWSGTCSHRNHSSGRCPAWGSSCCGHCAQRSSGGCWSPCGCGWRGWPWSQNEATQPGIMDKINFHSNHTFKFKAKLALCPPRCFTTQVNWADLPAATVRLSNGDTNPGSYACTAKNG